MLGFGASYIRDLTVTPLLKHWSYVFLALTHRYDIDCCSVLAWWWQGCQCGMRHGLWLADVTFCVIGCSKSKHSFGIPQLQWILGNLQCIYGLISRVREFPWFLKNNWQSLAHPGRLWKMSNGIVFGALYGSTKIELLQCISNTVYVSFGLCSNPLKFGMYHNLKVKTGKKNRHIIVLDLVSSSLKFENVLGNLTFGEIVGMAEGRWWCYWCKHESWHFQW